ncbi:Cytochrome P450-33C9 [Aphelenchoides fujianensis]|nr:Cytochrome P450-33C9 [Aphelenchoides fujianensis]
MSRIDAQVAKKDGFVRVDELIDISVGSIINALMYTDDKIDEFNDLKKRAQSFVQSNGHPSQRLIREWPNLYRHLPYFKDRVKDAQKSAQFLFQFFRERIEEHRRELNEKDLEDAAPTDFVMGFLQEMKRREERGETEIFHEDQLVVLLFDLWVAGQETTSNTIGWTFAYLLHHPEVQRKAQEELKRVIGTNRIITTADKPSLPYITCDRARRPTYGQPASHQSFSTEPLGT